MTHILNVTSGMDAAHIEGLMPVVDFAVHAMEAAQGRALAGAVVCTLHEIDGLHVLYFPETETALVNQISTGTGDSTYFEGMRSPRDAADAFKASEADKAREEALFDLACAMWAVRGDLKTMSLDEWLAEHQAHLSEGERAAARAILGLF